MQELAGSSSWQINAQERTKFVDIFEKADDDRDGFVTGILLCLFIIKPKSVLTVMHFQRLKQ